ncbi:hypothetical protein L3V82_12825 [Thiotrichales bacterium 19S3-7]|nr:hypothetical protein [Thiotrichales bacterium 19S3-7]MCF6803056.1 hypothetical protein [Thiotrichales bacterium 19S3-11]
MTKQKKDIFKPLDQEEKELMDLLEQGEYHVTKNKDEEIKKLQSAALSHKKQTASVNFKAYADDVLLLKKIAELEGLDYQPFLRSLVHKYVTGQLLDTSSLGDKVLIIRGKPDKAVSRFIEEGGNITLKTLSSN